MSIDRGMDKENMVYTILLSHKKDKIMPLATMWVDLDIIILSEVNQRNRNIGRHYLCMKSNFKMTQMNLFIYKIETDSKISQSNFWFPREKCVCGGGGVIN